ncbi:serine hydrolase domain-containing protein [Hymenobacter persicinus]|uniref:Class A beta-lactamase-related serine hydrolase n=1 Tax=Hymenobacter persicinus TaxID=2025506 RepID=A0A4V1ZB47_9BACT|nr:serine hydrolase domain-containing protein [Hymenobacter persicinus]RYU82853.1 class A beta-lactamase-related serine hydrolase [Hymenobacter persicinus]
MKTILLLALLLLSALVAPAQHAGLAALLQQQRVPGMQLIHTKGGKTTAYSVGQRRAGQAAPVTAGTIFQAASLGKVVLAYAALRLVDQGRLDLDQPLLTYGPYPRLNGEPRAARITARMVLGHTTGLPNWADNPLGPTWKTSVLRLKFAPDSCWSYSGEGYAFLQKTLEHITGESWEVLARQQVFGPLKMTNSSFVWQPRFAANAATGHDKAGKPTEIRQFQEANAGFSLLTTAADYRRFVQALATGTGLTPATARLLTTAANAANRCGHAPTPTDARIAWACGVGLVNTSRGPALWHWGDNDDCQNFFLTFPATGESLVFFTNGANGLRLTDELLRRFVGPGEYYTQQWLNEK